MIRFWVQYSGVAARLVGHPVLVGVPERARLEDHDPPAAAGQPLGEHRAARAGTDDHQVDLVVVGVAAHGRLAGQVAAVHVEQVPGVVVARADRALEHPAPERAHQRCPASSSRTGSAATAPGLLERLPARVAPGRPAA